MTGTVNVDDGVIGSSVLVPAMPVAVQVTSHVELTSTSWVPASSKASVQPASVPSSAGRHAVVNSS